MSGPQHTEPLGEFLVKGGICTNDQIEKALNAQVVYGGKLGTNLLEQGLIDLRTLAKALGKVHHVRALDPMQPIRIPEPTVRMFPPRFAKQHGAIPLSDDGKKLFVLMMDPSNRNTLETIAKGTRRQVFPVILPEVRLRLLLEKYYNIQQDLRYLTLARNLAANDGRIPPPAPSSQAADDEDLMSEEVFQEQLTKMGGAAGAGLHVVDREQLAAEAGASPDEIIPEDDEVLEIAESDLIPIEDELEDEEWASYMGEAGAQPVDLPEDESFEDSQAILEADLDEEEDEEVAPIDMHEAQARLDAATSRDDIAKAMLALCRKTFPRAVLFIARRGRLSGWDAAGEGIDSQTIRNLVISLQQPSAFKLVYDTSAHFLGAMQPGEINDGFMKMLGGEPPRSVFLYPILFRGKVVNMIYADGGPGKNAPVDVSDLLIVGPKVPQTFERLLQRARGK